MADQMSNRLKSEIVNALINLNMRSLLTLRHADTNVPRHVIWDDLKILKKDFNSFFKWAKEEYRKECYGIRKEQE